MPVAHLTRRSTGERPGVCERDEMTGDHGFASAGLPAEPDAREEITGMSRTQSAAVAVQGESDVHTRRRAQEAVQEAMDRRDNGGDSAATDN
jgi:hypothetical protein